MKKFQPAFRPFQYRFKSSPNQQPTPQTAADRRRLEEYLLQSDPYAPYGVIPQRTRRRTESPLMMRFGQMPDVLRQHQMMKRKKNKRPK